MVTSQFQVEKHSFLKIFVELQMYNFRSVKIGVMEVGEELARRGHEVTVVSPHKYKSVPPGVRDVVFHSEFEKITTELTELFLRDPSAGLPFNQVSFL